VLDEMISNLLKYIIPTSRGHFADAARRGDLAKETAEGLGLR
jgi:hypothetical protein